jgi:hypothetical protein
MVNPGLVNAGPSYFPRATFCEIFLVSGRFPHFENPFKYAGSFNINHETVHFPPGRGPRRFAFMLLNQRLTQRLKLQKEP